MPVISAYSSSGSSYISTSRYPKSSYSDRKYYPSLSSGISSTSSSGGLYRKSSYRYELPLSPVASSSSYYTRENRDTYRAGESSHSSHTQGAVTNGVSATATSTGNSSGANANTTTPTSSASTSAISSNTRPNRYSSTYSGYGTLGSSSYSRDYSYTRGVTSSGSSSSSSSYVSNLRNTALCGAELYQRYSLSTFKPAPSIVSRATTGGAPQSVSSLASIRGSSPIVPSLDGTKITNNNSNSSSSSNSGGKATIKLRPSASSRSATAATAAVAPAATSTAGPAAAAAAAAAVTVGTTAPNSSVPNGGGVASGANYGGVASVVVVGSSKPSTLATVSATTDDLRGESNSSSRTGADGDGDFHVTATIRIKPKGIGLVHQTDRHDSKSRNGGVGGNSSSSTSLNFKHVDNDESSNQANNNIQATNNNVHVPVAGGPTCSKNGNHNNNNNNINNNNNNSSNSYESANGLIKSSSDRSGGSSSSSSSSSSSTSNNSISGAVTKPTLITTNTTTTTTTTITSTATTATTVGSTNSSANSTLNGHDDSVEEKPKANDDDRVSYLRTGSSSKGLSSASNSYRSSKDYDAAYRVPSSSTSGSTALQKSNYDTGYDTTDSVRGRKEGLCGLWNIGNTCFMNSMIQCLSHTRELTSFLRSQSSNERGTNKDHRILAEYTKLIKDMWSGTQRSVNPSELKYAFSSKHRMYSGSAQQDAQEFLRFFLDSLHGALNAAVKRDPLGELDDDMSNRFKADMLWEWYSKAENSVIKDLFVGQLRSTLKCTYCSTESTMFDPFWDLSLPLPTSNSRCKLENCLEMFIKEEVLDGIDQPTCSKCNMRRKCTKSLTIERFPKYLVIHLKRFSETRWSKLTNVIEFPTGDRELNLQPYASEDHSGPVTYSLYGISNHMGSTAGGHYIAVCKHPITKEWNEFNDNFVSETSERSLVTSSAYVLFYERA
ncbi:ubiquitin carboxyl-terminal hydrolase Usp2-like [Anopheles bellator]|uniref:ubiquitin carboxyl-terminal hydrolase Usp2-like n=1 Tax=Anopheles bellator TaxID=139047 RepID=UPI002649029A|nr:ubiquitin carboxyl-terminal hydrolase Usp2-like [Anopheles bellator]